MTELKSRVFSEGNSYMVFIEVILEGRLASYLLHCEGNPRVLYRIFKECKGFLHPDKYFMLKDEKFFRNHCVEYSRDDSGDIIYKYTGE